MCHGTVKTHQCCLSKYILIAGCGVARNLRRPLAASISCVSWRTVSVPHVLEVILAARIHGSVVPPTTEIATYRWKINNRCVAGYQYPLVIRNMCLTWAQLAPLGEVSRRRRYSRRL